MIPFRGKRVELDDGREVVVPGFGYLEAKKHLELMRDNPDADRYMLDAIGVLLRRNHPEIEQADVDAQSASTIHDLWAAGMRTSNEGTIPGEAKRRP